METNTHFSHSWNIFSLRISAPSRNNFPSIPHGITVLYRITHIITHYTPFSASNGCVASCDMPSSLPRILLNVYLLFSFFCFLWCGCCRCYCWLRFGHSERFSEGSSAGSGFSYAVRESRITERSDWPKGHRCDRSEYLLHWFSAKRVWRLG